MSSQSVAYALGGTLTEQQRLIAQAKGLEVHANWLLDEIGIASGQRTVDVGCGPIGILNLLSARVGRDGVVIGVEREPRFFDMAQSELDTRRLQNVKLVKADALHTGLERNSYDFVHERLLLINFPPASRHALLTEMIALLKPGGVRSGLESAKWFEGVLMSAIGPKQTRLLHRTCPLLGVKRTSPP